MNTASQCFFVPLPARDAYQAWKSHLGFPDMEQTRQRRLTVIEDREDEVQWRSRWGVLTVEGRTDFIPVQGGCILHVKFMAAGFLPRVLLYANRPSGSSLDALTDRPAEGRRGLLRLIPYRAVARLFDVSR